MASRKKSVKKEELEVIAQSVQEVSEETTVKNETVTINEKESKNKTSKKQEKTPKFPVGSVVYVSKETSADLNGFNLSISQYKKEAYTVEAYDENTGVYKIRHIKLLLRLKEADLVAPDANAHDSINRKQF